MPFGIADERSDEEPLAHVHPDQPPLSPLDAAFLKDVIDCVWLDHNRSWSGLYFENADEVPVLDNQALNAVAEHEPFRSGETYLAHWFRGDAEVEEILPLMARAGFSREETDRAMGRLRKLMPQADVVTAWCRRTGSPDIAGSIGLKRALYVQMTEGRRITIDYRATVEHFSLKNEVDRYPLLLIADDTIQCDLQVVASNMQYLEIPCSIQVFVRAQASGPEAGAADKLCAFTEFTVTDELRDRNPLMRFPTPILEIEG